MKKPEKKTLRIQKSHKMQIYLTTSEYKRLEEEKGEYKSWGKFGRYKVLGYED